MTFTDETDEEIEEIKCLRAVLERVLRVMDEGLFVDYQLEKWGKIIKKMDDKKLVDLVRIEDSIKDSENRKIFKEMVERKLKGMMFMTDGKTPKCMYCGQPMKNQIDSITKKISQYLWACDCPGFPKSMIISIG